MLLAYSRAPPKTTPNKLEPKTWLRFSSSFKDVEKISEANPTGIGQAKRGTTLLSFKKVSGSHSTAAQIEKDCRVDNGYAAIVRRKKCWCGPGHTIDKGSWKRPEERRGKIAGRVGWDIADDMECPSEQNPGRAAYQSPDQKKT